MSRTGSMSDEKNSNGKNGKSVGLVDRIKSGVREDIDSLKTDLPAKAKEQIDSLRKPTKTQLYTSILRNMHRWAAHLMVIAVELHMFRVFLTGSYKKPREFNWNVGVILLVLTLLLSFTGYLLPDDQLGFWAVTVGTNMARATPLLGHEGPFGEQMGMTPYNDVRFGLLGGSIVDANALLRSYIWHCIGIPIIASIFMVLHFWRVRKDGGISGPAAVVLDSEVKEAKK